MRHLLAPALLLAALLPGAAHAGTTLDFDPSAYDQGIIAPARPLAASVAVVQQYGPFRVVGPDRAELDGSIESDTPAQFRAMLRSHPGIRQIDMVDCPGTGDDEANLALARMVRQAGIATYVPEGGSVRSGGVELFLAGAKRSAAPSAEFAVHSWMDEDGLEPDDFADDDPVNLEYIDFYREMGLTDANARAFYALTNSVPNDDALILHTNDIARFVALN
jgi:hypothetical protein